MSWVWREKVPVGMATLLAVLGATAPARSQQESVAESLFRRAREEMKRGEPAAACPKFEESYRLDPASGTLLNLALCEEALGNTATAWAKFRQFVDSAPSGDDRLDLARKKIAELEPQLAKLSLIVEGNAKAVVLLDGVELREASLSQAIPVNPGEHAVTVKLLTGEASETPFRIRVAEALSLRVATPPRLAPFEPAAAATAPPARTAPSAAVSASSSPTATDRSGERALAYGLGAVGVAGLVTSGIFGLLALGNRNTVREQCPNHECSDQAGLDAAEAGARNETIANAALIVGAVGLVSGSVLLWHSGRTSAAVSASATSASLYVVGVIQ